jgi:hypothetical protein
MDTDKQDELLKWFEVASGASHADDAFHPASLASEEGEMVEETSQPAETSAGMQPRMEVAATPEGQNVHSQTQTESQGSGGSSAGSILMDVLESGFGVVPLAGELFSLFGGGQKAPAQTVKYQMPASISFMSAETGGGLTAAGYDQAGLPRLYDETGNGTIREDSAKPTAARPASDTSATAPQITVNVQAMDARSFLDRSNDIAQAVRKAMLSMSSINDMVNEL